MSSAQNRRRGSGRGLPSPGLQPPSNPTTSYRSTANRTSAMDSGPVLQPRPRGVDGVQHQVTFPATPSPEFSPTSENFKPSGGFSMPSLQSFVGLGFDPVKRQLSPPPSPTSNKISLPAPQPTSRARNASAFVPATPDINLNDAPFFTSRPVTPQPSPPPNVTSDSIATMYRDDEPKGWNPLRTAQILALRVFGRKADFLRRQSTSSSSVREKKKLQRKWRKNILGRQSSLKLVVFVLILSVLLYRRISAWLWDSGSPASPLPASTSGFGAMRKMTARKASAAPASNYPDYYDGIPPYVYNGTALPHPISNGMLKVNVDAPAGTSHPIFQLIKDARDAWETKVKGQSSTLKEAVAEYKRRNKGMAPPKGFDKWWKFVVENDVQLPDEYDQINKDLYIYRAISPSVLRTWVEEASNQIDTFSITISRGVLRTKTMYEVEFAGAFERLEGQVGLVQDFDLVKDLPDVKVVFGVHDTPTGFMGWDHKHDLMERVDDGEYYDPEEQEIDTTVRGWTHACAPYSPAKTFDRFAPITKSKHSKSLVADHYATFDLCEHPNALSLHGVTSGKNPHVQPRLSPVFSLSKTSLHTDVLGVPVEQWTESMPNAPAWRDKKDDRLMWRGSNTGTYHSQGTPWRVSHRTRLVGMAGWEASGEVDIIPPPVEGETKSIKESMLRASVQTLNKGTLDIAFSGVPIQCDHEDGTCADISEEYDFDPKPMTHDQALEYKYIMDVDGNAWSARTKRLFASGGLIFKSTIMPEWWSLRVQPWVHYVPIQIDYSDIHDTLTFFRGDMYGRGGQQHLAEQIAVAGKEWSEKHWRRVDMAAYTYRLYLEWARLLAPSRRGSDFVYSEDMEPSRTAK